jgi:hypothetical protein
MSKKGITRYEFKWHPMYGLALLGHDNGDYVKYEDHLQALGEAEKEHDEKCHSFIEDISAWTARATSAEQSLQTLRLALEAEVDAFLCGDGRESLADALGRMIGDPHAAKTYTSGLVAMITDRLQQLLDQPSETAGEVCEYCDGDTGYWVQSGRFVDGKPVEKRTWVKCEVCQSAETAGAE